MPALELFFLPIYRFNIEFFRFQNCLSCTKYSRKELWVSVSVLILSNEKKDGPYGE